MKRYWHIVVLFLMAPALAGCLTTNPATGGKDFTPFMSPAQERQVGIQQHPVILQQFGGVYDDPKLAGYVAQIGGSVAANSELPATHFTVTLLDSPVVNAFALPGGFVYVTRGLMALANSEAELAGVLAHEVGHVTARHTARRVSRATGVNILAVGLAILTGSREVAELGQLGGSAYLASFSRDQEFEADYLGVRYMTRAGYAPKAQAQLLAGLGRHGDLLGKLNPGQSRGPDIFATHPQTPERVARALNAAEQAGAPADAPYRQDAYFDQIDGMIFGSDPNQGYLRGQDYLHPLARIGIKFPNGYQLNSAQGRLFGKHQKISQLLVEAATEAGLTKSTDPRTYLTSIWKHKLKMNNVQRATINGVTVAYGGARVRSKSGGYIDVTLGALSASNGEKLLKITHVADPKRSDGNGQGFQAVIKGLKKLTAREATAVKPRRMHIITVRKGDTVESLAEKMQVEKEKIAWFETLNNVKAGEALTPGRRVKVIGY